MVVEVAECCFDVTGELFYARNPRFKFLDGVSIVEPRICAMSMPTNVGEISSDSKVYGELGFINNDIGNPIVLQCIPNRGLQPGLIPEFDCISKRRVQ